MPSSSRIGVPWRKPRQRRDQQPLLAQRRPIALRVFEQLVRLRHPDRAAAPFQPIVQQDAGDLASLAAASAIAQEPAAPEADALLGIVRRGGDAVIGGVNDPRTCEMPGMGLAGIDHAFQLRVRQQSVGDDPARKLRAIARLGRSDRGHRGRLDKLGRVGQGPGNLYRLKRIAFVDRLGQVGGRVRSPIIRLVREFDDFGFDGGRGQGGSCGVRRDQFSGRCNRDRASRKPNR